MEQKNINDIWLMLGTMNGTLSALNDLVTKHVVDDDLIEKRVTSLEARNSFERGVMVAATAVATLIGGGVSFVLAKVI